MRNTFRNNDGFTLVELLVTILTGSIIMLAAVSVLLLGVRINVQSMGTANRQTTTRILMSSLEDLASEGTIAGVAYTLDSWKVYGAGGENDVLYAYNSADQTISSGREGSKSTIMEGVIFSDVALDGQLLTVSITTEDGTYTTSVYCRTHKVEDKSEDSYNQAINDLLNTGNGNNGSQTTDHAAEFLKNLASQYAMKESGLSIRNPGLILDKNGKSTGEYFSEWYIGSYAANPGWNSSTPWCACFVSWGLLDGDDPLVSLGDVHPKGFANVDNFMNYLKKNDEGHQWKYAEDYRAESNIKPGINYPQPGDLIFFDWKINNIRDPEHIGAVVKVDDNYVYTIEGNSSNRVAIRRYRIDDPRILGYGVLVWENYAK